MLLFWTTNTAVVTSRANQQLGNVRKPYIHSNLLLMLLLFSWWCQSIGCVLKTLLSSFFTTKQATKSIKMLSQCKSFCIPQFTPWFETRCTVDIDGFYNFRYPLCMGKLSYLKQKDVTPLITIFTAEDDVTMNGRKPGWTKVLHQMFTRRWDMGTSVARHSTRRHPSRHRTVTTSGHVSSLLVTPRERHGNEVYI